MMMMSSVNERPNYPGAATTAAVCLRSFHRSSRDVAIASMTKQGQISCPERGPTRKKKKKKKKGRKT